MPKIPALPTWGPTGVITATTVNNNLSTTRTYVNDYAAWIDVANTFSAAQAFGAGLTGTTIAMSSTISGTTLTGTTHVSGGSVGGGAAVLVKPGTSADHCYVSFYARSADASTETGYLGYPSSGSTTLRLLNQLAGNLEIGTNGSVRVTISSAGLVTLNAGLTISSGTTTVGALVCTTIVAGGAVSGITTLAATTATFTTLAGAVNFSGTPTFGAGLTVTSGTATLLAVTSGAITATGNSTITGTLGGVTTLTCTTVTATNLGGTLSTAAQANVTSLGTLTALTVSGVAIDRLTGGGNKISEATTNGDYWIGPQSALATSATAGMLILPGCNGTPSGARALGTGGFPMVIDYSASKIWVNFGGTWRATAALT